MVSSGPPRCHPTRSMTGAPLFHILLLFPLTLITCVHTPHPACTRLFAIRARMHRWRNSLICPAEGTAGIAAETKDKGASSLPKLAHLVAHDADGAAHDRASIDVCSLKGNFDADGLHCVERVES